MMKFLVPAALAALALGATSASAITVTQISGDFAPIAQPSPTSTTGVVNEGLVGGNPGMGADAWLGTDFAGIAEFTSVTGQSSATFVFDTLMNDIQFLWGTPDSYNTLSFFLGNTLVDAIDGDETGIPNFETQFPQFVSASSDSMFDTVVFSSSVNSFEYAFFEDIAAVPVPASGLLAGFAMAGLFGFGRLKQLKKS